MSPFYPFYPRRAGGLSPPIPPTPFPPRRGGKGERTATFGFVASATNLLAWHLRYFARNYSVQSCARMLASQLPVVP